MPPPGGRAGKAGDRYEAIWATVQFVRVLRGEAEWIHLESYGVDEAEFQVRVNGRTEYHQVKRQKTGGDWTIASLESVLRGFRRLLSDASTECVFVSQTSATELNEWLTETNKDLTGFERRIEDTKTLKNQLDLLLADFQAQDLAELASFLGRIRNNASYSEDLLEDKVQLSLLTTVHGAPANALAHLFKLFFDAQGEKLTSSDLRSYLDGHGHGVVDDLQLKPSTADLHEVTDRYLKTVQDIAIANEVIPRAEADNIIELLADPETKAVLVLGPAGSGKSGVVRQVVLKAIDRGWPVLAFRADGIGEVHDAEQLGTALHLATSPAAVLAGISGNETALLVIDQMDAVSLTSGRQHASFQALRQVIDDVSIQDRVRVVIACREFDATHDYRLKALFDDDRHRMNSIPVPPLDRGTVETILRRLAIDPDGLGDKQYEVLKTPLHLALLAEIRETDLARAMDFIDPQELFDVYWDRKRQRLVERLGRPVLWNSVIDTACDATERLRQLTFPWSYLSEVEDDARALVSEGVLVNRDDKVSFFHEQLLDYAFARRLTERGISLVQLLTGGGQDLYRRAQVRQVLTYERVARPQQYRDDLKMLLSDQRIRFHIKQAAVWHLGTLRDPSVDEWDILKTHLEQVDGQLSQLIAQLVRGSSQWFELLVQTGYMAAWLQSEDGRLVDRGVEVLASRCREQPEEVAQLLEPYIDDSSAWSNRLLFVLTWNRPSSRRLLDLYLRLIDTGVLDDARGPIAVNSDFWDLAYGLADDHPDWAAEFAAHRLRRQLKVMAERVGDQGVAP